MGFFQGTFEDNAVIGIFDPSLFLFGCGQGTDEGIHQSTNKAIDVSRTLYGAGNVDGADVGDTGQTGGLAETLFLVGIDQKDHGNAGLFNSG
jgi:hypothetical protein